VLTGKLEMALEAVQSGHQIKPLRKVLPHKLKPWLWAALREVALQLRYNRC
jgi:hypothetical protein